MAPFQEYTDPRLVALYDALNPFGPDTGFYLELAADLGVSSVLDIGCGTGLLACELARQGHRVIGADPSPAMLAVARARPGADVVRWVAGEAAQLAGTGADLAVLSGHVCQVIAEDDRWQAALADIHAALRPGGWLAFESRNPAARAWLDWKPETTRKRVGDGAGGQVESWTQVTAGTDGLVRFEIHYRFESAGEELVSAGELRFRDQQELTRALTGAGFAVEHVYGDWDRRPVSAGSPELIFVAARR
jgi:SAM-dependent methyltransferase